MKRPLLTFQEFLETRPSVPRYEATPEEIISVVTPERAELYRRYRREVMEKRRALTDAGWAPHKGRLHKPKKER